MNNTKTTNFIRAKPCTLFCAKDDKNKANIGESGAAAMAIKMGKACFVQKPLTHAISEARALSELATKHNVATMMGNQGTANTALRIGAAAIQAGTIGTVKEVHVWTNRPIWPQGMAAFPAGEEAPKHINWDLWLGPAPQHDYSEKIMPFNWRGYWDFGTGALGDMACHVMDMAYWSLEPVSYPHLTPPTSYSV